MENVNNFLKEYLALCEKYQLIISGCGCCDSPYVAKPTKEKSIKGNFNHLKAGVEEYSYSYWDS